MKKLLNWWPLLVVVLVLCCVFYVIDSAEDPDSYWCLWQIYQYPDNHYEVWYRGKSTFREFSGNYQAAREYQINECKKLKAFMAQSPQGKRVTKQIDP